MSSQVPDLLIRDGEEVALLTNPLNAYIQELGHGWPFVSRWTANIRGYVATWAIRDGVLLLVRLRGWLARRPLRGVTPGDVTIRENLAELLDLRSQVDCQGASDSLDGPDLPLAVLFPGQTGPVEASWYSGTLRVPKGERLAQLGMGYLAVYERELRITVERGIVSQAIEVAPMDHPEEWQLIAMLMAGKARGVRADPNGSVLCPHCGERFKVDDKADWDGHRHRCGGFIVIG